MTARIDQSLANLGRALDRLGEALAEPEASPLVIDGTIQQFEFTLDLTWKTLKRQLEAEGIRAATPREALKQAYQAGWLDDEAAWLQMLKDRNETSHIYDEATARRIYGNIRAHYPALRAAFDVLRARAGRNGSP